MSSMPPAASRRAWLVAGAAAVALPRARAQGAVPRRIGVAMSGTPETSERYAEALRRGLAQQGSQPGRDVELVVGYAMGRRERNAAVVAELLAARVEVLVVGANSMAWPAKAATTTLPIVMALSADPEASGLVASLSRPGGNVTGLSLLTATMAGKRLQQLRELVPGAAQIAYLADPGVPGWERSLGEVEKAAAAQALRLRVLQATSADEIDRALATLTARRPDALLVGSAALFFVHRRRIVEFCAAHKLPASHAGSEAVAEGGLISYSASTAQAFERAAYFVARILAGAKPADLPVEQPLHYVLAINLGTARALGLTVPRALLAAADIVVP
jgi:putative ABC transport system substrate-binding protein